LCLIDCSTLCRIIEHGQSLSCSHRVSRAHQYLLDAAGNLRGNERGLTCVNGSRSAHVDRHLSLLALNDPRLHSFDGACCD
jgi:hypothetical protein